MRVLQAMAGAEFGGAEAFFERLTVALAKTGLEQRVVIRTNPDRAQRMRDAGVQPVELPFGGRFDWKTPRALKREIKDFEPDIVLTWMSRATDKCPKGDFVHVARLGGYYDLKYYQNCDHLIGNTRDIVTYLAEQGFEAEKVHYLPNFVSEARGTPMSRQAFFTPEEIPIILALGRLHTNKAFDVLIHSLERLPEVYLWLAGDGPEKKALETLSEELGVRPRVRFLGWRDNVADLFATADLFVCPSRHEPLGNVVLEAWAQGLPVVAAESSGPASLIDHLKTGMLTPVDDYKAMADAIKHMLRNHDDRVAMASAGEAAFRQSFTEKAVVDQYLHFFERVTA